MPSDGIVHASFFSPRFRECIPHPDGAATSTDRIGRNVRKLPKKFPFATTVFSMVSCQGGKVSLGSPCRSRLLARSECQVAALLRARSRKRRSLEGMHEPARLDAAAHPRFLQEKCRLRHNDAHLRQRDPPRSAAS